MTPAGVLAWGPVINAIITIAERIADRVRKRRADRALRESEAARLRAQQKQARKEAAARSNAPTRRVKPVRDPQR